MGHGDKKFFEKTTIFSTWAIVELCGFRPHTQLLSCSLHRDPDGPGRGLQLLLPHSCLILVPGAVTHANWPTGRIPGEFENFKDKLCSQIVGRLVVYLVYFLSSLKVLI